MVNLIFTTLFDDKTLMEFLPIDILFLFVSCHPSWKDNYNTFLEMSSTNKFFQRVYEKVPIIVITRVTLRTPSLIAKILVTHDVKGNVKSETVEDVSRNCVGLTKDDSACYYWQNIKTIKQGIHKTTINDRLVSVVCKRDLYKRDLYKN